MRPFLTVWEDAQMGQTGMRAKHQQETLLLYHYILSATGSGRTATNCPSIPLHPNFVMGAVPLRAFRWVINDKGEVVLTAQAPTVIPNIPWMTSATCHGSSTFHKQSLERAKRWPMPKISSTKSTGVTNYRRRSRYLSLVETWSVKHPWIKFY